MAKIIAGIQKEAHPRIVSIDGGLAHNAIPAFCTAVITVQPPAKCTAEGCTPLTHFKEMFDKVNECYKTKEPEAKIEISMTEAKDAFSVEDSRNIVDVLLNLPHGPIRISQDVKDFVETSFATTVIETKGENVHILGSARSCYEQEMDYIYYRLKALAELSGWKISDMLQRYPGWPAKMDSPLLKIVEAAYKKQSNEV